MSADPHALAYDAIAQEFAQRNATMPPLLVELAGDLLTRLSRRPRLLDVGCGPGRDMAWFEEAGAVVVGVDVSPAMLRRARDAVRGRLVAADMRSLPFADASFDGVWCIASLLHIPKTDAPAVLAEIHRVLAPAGIVVVSLKRGTTERWESGPPGWPDRFFARYEPAELVALLEAAGFMPGPIRETEGSADPWLSTVASCPGDSSRAAPGSP